MIQGNLKNFRGRARRLAQTIQDNTGSSAQDDAEIDAGGSGQDEMEVDPATSRPPSPLTSDSDSSDSSDDDDE